MPAQRNIIMAGKEKTLSRKFVAVQNNECNYINCLPPEIIFKILNNLDIKSLCNIKMTCKRLNEISEYDELWRRHCLAHKAVCPSEIDEDRAQGYTWQKTLRRNYSKGIIKQQWMDGRFSKIASYSELQKKSMCPMSASSWGDILDAELTRDTQRHI